MVHKLRTSINSKVLASELNLEHSGEEREVVGIGPLAAQEEGHLFFSSRTDIRYRLGGVCIAITAEGQSEGMTVLLAKTPRLAFIRALSWFDSRDLFTRLNNEPVIHATAEIGRNAVIENDCEISEGVVIEPNVVIMRGTRIGANTRVRANSSIGSDGFGFERDSDGGIFRFPHLGGVRIGESVEIGANTCIARGTLSDTVIEDHAKIDNLVHIAHNVYVESGAFIIAGAEISGGCRVGRSSWVGPNACVIEKKNIGAGALVGIGSTVIKDIPAYEIHAGNPARFIRKIGG